MRPLSPRQSVELKFVGTGFLSPEGLNEAQQLREQIAPLLDLVTRVIALCHRGLISVEIGGQSTDKEKQKVIACVMLARLLEISEATLLLARGGFSVEVTSGLRTFLDAYFIFGNVCQDPQFVPQYFNTDLTMREKLINVALKHNAAPFQLCKAYASQAVRDDLKAHIAAASATEFNSYEYARNVGCTAIYDSLFRLASAATHSTPRSLSDYITENEHGEIVELHRHPQLSDIPARLFDLGHFLLNVCSAFDELFDVEHAVEIQALRGEIETVVVPE